MTKTYSIVELLKELNQIREARTSEIKSKWERLATTISEALMILAGISFAILAALGTWNKFASTLPEEAKFIALFFGIVAMLLPVISMVIGIVLSIFSVFKMHSTEFERFLKEIEIHQNWIRSLNEYPQALLEEAARYLRLKISRQRNRISLFFGSPDKAALFSLAGMGWLVFKEINPKNKDALLANIAIGELNIETLIFYVIAFLTGIALGAVMMNGFIQKYIYQLEVLELSQASRQSTIEPKKQNPERDENSMFRQNSTNEGGHISN